MVRTIKDSHMETLDDLVRRLNYGMQKELYRDAERNPRRYVEKLLRISAAQRKRRLARGT